MKEEQAALIRALVAAQVAVLDWGEEDIRHYGESPAILALEECSKQIRKGIKRLKEAV